MLNVRLSQPFVGLVINKTGILSRKESRLFNRDNYVREAVTALLLEKHEAEGSALGFVNEGDDESVLLRFLNWLIENQDAIKAFIQMIMSLFVLGEEEVNKETNVLGPIKRI